MSSLVLIPDRLKPPAEIEKQVLGPHTEVVLGQATHADQIDERCWRRCDAVLAWHELFYSRELLSKMANCKVLVRVGVGYDNVDLQAASDKGIAVCNVPDYGTEDVADHTMALMLSLLRGIDAYHRAARRGQWEWNAAPELRRLRGRKLGVVGLGRIGTAVVLRARSFGLDIGFYDPYKADGHDKSLGISRYERFQDLVADCDIISLHAPATPETEGMIDRRFLEQCKDGVVLINTARGKIVEPAALAAGLKSGKIGAAGLDVLAHEPPDIRDPLMRAWQNKEKWLRGRLIITPHAAFYNRDSVRELRRKAAEEALRVLKGGAPRNRIV